MSSNEFFGLLGTWDLLDVYRDRYAIEDRLQGVLRLQRTLHRKQAKSDALFRRVQELERHLAEARRELDAIRDEVAGTSTAGRLALDDVLADVKEEFDEGWSPTAVLGFRMWVLRENGLHGAKTTWRIPRLRSICLNAVPGQDVPHSMARCGPPPCGVYATKTVATLRKDLGVGDIDGYVLGVAALSGKVVEHELGYRGEMAEVVALGGKWSDRHVMTDDSERIAAIFANPDEAIADFGVSGKPPGAAIDDYLSNWKEERSQWIWEEKSA
jgi:hypothetical protein